MANIDDKKIPVGGKEIPIPGRLHDVSEDHVVTGANEVFDDDFGERQSQVNVKQKHFTQLAHIRIDGERNVRESSDILLRNELNSKQLEIGAVQTDAEPIKNSPNHLTSGAIAASSGYYVNSPEWARLYVDAAKRIVFGIRTDGSIEWAVGIPTPIREEIDRIVENFNGTIEELSTTITEALEGKVDKEEGKSLIDAEYADGIYVHDSPEFVEVHLTKNKKILYAVDNKGDFIFGCGVPSAIEEAISAARTYLEKILYLDSSRGYSALVIDSLKHILFSIDNEGNIDWAKGIPTPIKDEMLKYHTYIDSNEFAFLIVDALKRIVFGITVRGEIVGNISNKEESRDDTDTPDNPWKGKKIVWYGTSIPAGSSDSVEINGAPVKYLPSYGYGKDIWTTGGVKSPNQYPVMVGSLLNVDTVYNESLGSSSAAAHTRNSSLELLCKGMGNTASQICGWLLDCYNIDWTNRTYSRNLNNSCGVTEFLVDGNWSQLMGSFYVCIRISYQIALVARYLIKDNTEHQAYVESIFGSYYATFKNGLATAGLDLDEMCRYKGDVDMIVFDHGFNDPTTVGDEMTTFEGAMTEFFSEIYYYKPRVRIVMISDYVTVHNARGVVERQKNLAAKWGIPIADMSAVLQVSNTVKAKSRGYWSNGRWHDTGFTFSVSGNSYTTNNSFASMLFCMGKSDTLQNVMDTFEPEQINGVWYWKAYPQCLWMQDALHPHSDKDGRLNILYARYLASYLSNIGHSYNK